MAILCHTRDSVFSGMIEFDVLCSGTDCPIGTYSNETGLTEEAECTACDPGMYCDTPGLTAPAGECDEGHYCDSAATR